MSQSCRLWRQPRRRYIPGSRTFNRKTIRKTAIPNCHAVGVLWTNLNASSAIQNNDVSVEFSQASTNQGPVEACKTTANSQLCETSPLIDQPRLIGCTKGDENRFAATGAIGDNERSIYSVKDIGAMSVCKITHANAIWEQVELTCAKWCFVANVN